MKRLFGNFDQDSGKNKSRAIEINKERNSGKIYEFLAETSTLPNSWMKPLGGVQEGYDKESVINDTPKSAELITHFTNTWIK